MACFTSLDAALERILSPHPNTQLAQPLAPNAHLQLCSADACFFSGGRRRLVFNGSALSARGRRRTLTTRENEESLSREFFPPSGTSSCSTSQFKWAALPFLVSRGPDGGEIAAVCRPGTSGLFAVLLALGLGAAPCGDMFFIEFLLCVDAMK